MINANNIKQLKQSKDRFNWNSISRPKMNTIHQYAGNKILDVGCSTGKYVAALSKQGYAAYGCDILSDRKWKEIGAKFFRKADIYNLPYPSKSFDTVMLFETLEHLTDPLPALNELIRVTKNNIIITIPNCDLPPVFQASGFIYWHYADRTHTNFYTQESIRKLLTSLGMKIDHLSLINPVMPETIFLNSWHIPLSISVLIGKIFQRMPFSSKYYTDIVVVGSVKKRKMISN